MEKKFNFTYITTNIINNKQYVGDHSTDKLNDSYLGSVQLIIKASKKYGKENFERKILEQFNTKQEAFDAQEKWINEYNNGLKNILINLSVKIPNGFFPGMLKQKN